MKKRYILALTLSVCLRTQSRAQTSDIFGPQESQQVVSRSGAQNIYVADLDGDGDRDILYTFPASNSSGVAWLQNDGNNRFFTRIISTRALEQERDVYAADLDGDGDQDVLFSSSRDNRVAWHQNDGQGNFEPARTITNNAAGVRSIYATDLDGDGDQDVLSASSGDDKIAWYENDGKGSFSRPQVITTSADGAWAVYSADLDGDGDPDVLSASSDGNEVVWYANDGRGNFEEQPAITTQADRARDVYAVDLDGDGDSDVLSASLRDDKIAWYENDGKGNFGAQRVINEPDPDRGFNFEVNVYAADFDNDGDQDVLANTGGIITWYANDGSGSFEGKEVINSYDYVVSDVYATDLDDDGDTDVLAASSILFLESRITWYENLSPPVSITKPTVESLTLIDARLDREIGDIGNEEVINLKDSRLFDYNVRANVANTGQKITRVDFDLQAPTQQDTMTREQIEPYMLYGDINGKARRRQAYAGDYTLTVTPYYLNSDSIEVAGVNKRVSFTFDAHNLEARNLRLVDTRTGRILEILFDRSAVKVSPDQPLSIVVDPNSPEFNSVEFSLDGPGDSEDYYALENLSPFAVFGDEGLNTTPNGRPLKDGFYRVRVIPYSRKNKGGFAGPEEDVTFIIVHRAETEAAAYPVPFTNEVNLRTAPVDMTTTRIRLIHAYGQVYEVSPEQITATEDGIKINLTNLPAGPYTIQLMQADQVQTFRGSKK